jgi:hypothetical protein
MVPLRILKSSALYHILIQANRNTKGVNTIYLHQLAYYTAVYVRNQICVCVSGLYVINPRPLLILRELFTLFVYDKELVKLLFMQFSLLLLFPPP